MVKKSHRARKAHRPQTKKAVFALALWDGQKIVGYYKADDHPPVDIKAKAAKFVNKQLAEENEEQANATWQLQQGWRFTVVEL